MGTTPRVINPKRGEIYLVAFDPTRGAEIQKTRPALIVQNDIDNRHSPITIALPITSRFEKPYPTEVSIPAGEGGLTVDSVALANQIRTVGKHRLVRRLGKIGSETMREAERALQLATRHDRSVNSNHACRSSRSRPNHPP